MSMRGGSDYHPGRFVGGTDVEAIHDNVAGEISAITQKHPLSASDIFVVEDSTDSNNKKKVLASSLVYTDNTSSVTFTANMILPLVTSSETGVIQKGANRFLHDFRHPTGGGAVPDGKNLFIGTNAGNFTMGSTAAATFEGSYNVGIGSGSLGATTTGNFNTNVGIDGMYSITTGYRNTNSGIDGLRGITTGYRNCSMGTNAGRYIADGSTANETSNTSCYLGDSTKAKADAGANEIVVGYNAIGEGSNTAKYGDANITGHYFSGSHYLQDTTTANAGILYKGTTRFLHNFHHPTGGGAVPDGQNTFLGLNSGNLTMGSTAASSFQSSYNVGIGDNSLDANTLGYSNTAVGVNSMGANTTGNSNAAIGLNSLFSNLGGYNNAACGVNCLYSTNSGYQNSSVGTNALYGNTTGFNNAGIGYQAGRYITGGATANETSTNSTYIGTDTRASADGNANETVIGYGVTGNGSNTTTIGNASITNTVITGRITTSGSRVVNTTTVGAATYDLLTTDEVLLVTYTVTGAVTSLTLPTAQVEDGRRIVVKDAGGNAGTNNITIDTEGAENIDGAATLVISTNYDKVTLICDGTNWFTI